MGIIDLLGGVADSLSPQQRQRIADAEQRLEALVKDNAALRVENDRLRAYVRELQGRVREEHEFQSHRGVLWKRDEPDPYCPKCKMVLARVPPGGMSLVCSSCSFEPTFTLRDVDTVRPR